MKPLEIRLVKSFQVCQIIRKSFSPCYLINETLMFLKPKRYSGLCPGTQMHAHHCLLYRHGNTGIFLLRECHYSRFGPTSAVSYVCYTSYLLLKEKKHLRMLNLKSARIMCSWAIEGCLYVHTQWNRIWHLWFTITSKSCSCWISFSPY